MLQMSPYVPARLFVLVIVALFYIYAGAIEPYEYEKPQYARKMKVLCKKTFPCDKSEKEPMCASFKYKKRDYWMVEIE